METTDAKQSHPQPPPERTYSRRDFLKKAAKVTTVAIIAAQLPDTKQLSTAPAEQENDLLVEKAQRLSNTFKTHYKDGGIVELNNDLQAVINPADHSMTVNDVKENKVIQDLPPMYLEENGHLIVHGKIESLPDTLRRSFSGWTAEEAPLFSSKEQVKQTIETKGRKTIILGDFKIDVDGKNNVVFLKNKQTDALLGTGRVTANGTFQIDNSSMKDPGYIKEKLSAMQIDVTQNELQKTYLKDEIKKFAKEENVEVKHFLQGKIVVSITKGNHVEFLDTISGERITGTVNPDTGEFFLEYPYNSKLDPPIIKKDFELSGFSVSEGMKKTKMSENAPATQVKAWNVFAPPDKTPSSFALEVTPPSAFELSPRSKISNVPQR